MHVCGNNAFEYLLSTYDVICKREAPKEAVLLVPAPRAPGATVCVTLRKQKGQEAVDGSGPKREFLGMAHQDSWAVAPALDHSAWGHQLAFFLAGTSSPPFVPLPLHLAMDLGTAGGTWWVLGC